MAQHRVLVLFAHPQLHTSRINRSLAQAVQGLEGVTFHDLYASYPHFFIDIPREKELLLAHDLIVLQHPFFWYSSPSLVKEWMDATLEHGWAYGEGGNKLRGKRMLMAVSTGGSRGAYQSDGTNRFSVPELLRPFELTAQLCGMQWLRPIVIHSAFHVTDSDLKAHGDRYRTTLETFVRVGSIPEHSPLRT